MPKEFLNTFLPEVQPDKFGRADVGEKLERGAKGTLHSLLHMALACQPTTKWPRIAHQRHIFRAMALEQYKNKGCRLQAVVMNEAGSAIVVAWSQTARKALRLSILSVLFRNGNFEFTPHSPGGDTRLSLALHASALAWLVVGP